MLKKTLARYAYLVCTHQIEQKWLSTILSNFSMFCCYPKFSFFYKKQKNKNKTLYHWK